MAVSINCKEADEREDSIIPNAGLWMPTLFIVVDKEWRCKSAEKGTISSLS